MSSWTWFRISFSMEHHSRRDAEIIPKRYWNEFSTGPGTRFSMTFLISDFRFRMSDDCHCEEGWLLSQTKARLTKQSQRKLRKHGDCFGASLLAMTRRDDCHCEVYLTLGRKGRSPRLTLVRPGRKAISSGDWDTGIANLRDCFVATLLAMTRRDDCHCEEGAKPPTKQSRLVAGTRGLPIYEIASSLRSSQRQGFGTECRRILRHSVSCQSY